jgi:predicted peptidase
MDRIISLNTENPYNLSYEIFFPKDYSAQQQLPLLIFLHGAGERGNNNTSQMKHMLLNLFKAEGSPLWDSIVICPQCPDGQQWVDTPWSKGGYTLDEVPESNEIKAALEILDFVENNYTTDLDRYYLTGLSMGGFAVWDMIMRHTERFAAAVPICGGADYTQASKLVNMPIYTFHDRGDTTVPPKGTQEMVAALTVLGGNIQYEELSGKGHNVWDYASSKAEVWTWLFEQVRSTAQE